MEEEEEGEEEREEEEWEEEEKEQEVEEEEGKEKEGKEQEEEGEEEEEKVRKYLWCSLCTLYLHACQVRVTVGDSSLCCCACVTYFER